MLPTPPPKAAVKKHMKLSTEEPRRARISDKPGLRQEMILRAQGVVGEFLLELTDSQKPDLSQLNRWRTSSLANRAEDAEAKTNCRRFTCSPIQRFSEDRRWLASLVRQSATLVTVCPLRPRTTATWRHEIFRKRSISRFASSRRPSLHKHIDELVVSGREAHRGVETANDIVPFGSALRLAERSNLEV